MSSFLLVFFIKWEPVKKKGLPHGSDFMLKLSIFKNLGICFQPIFAIYGVEILHNG